MITMIAAVDRGSLPLCNWFRAAPVDLAFIRQAANHAEKNVRIVAD
jgi:hypothetical protein